MAKAKPKSPAPDSLIRSTRELGTALGVSHVAVSGWMKDDRWSFPRTFPIKRELLPAIIAWKDSELRPASEPGANRVTNPDDLSAQGKAKFAKTMAEAQIKQFQLKLMKDQYHRVDDCRARSVQQFAVLKNGLRAIPNSLPFEADVKSMVLGRIDAWLRSLQQMNDDAKLYTEMVNDDLEAAIGLCAKRWNRRASLDVETVRVDLLAAFGDVVKKRCA
jgi:predicted DNA-binding transcriptional regulator AlpA